MRRPLFRRAPRQEPNPDGALPTKRGWSCGAALGCGRPGLPPYQHRGCRLCPTDLPASDPSARLNPERRAKPARSQGWHRRCPGRAPGLHLQGTRRRPPWAAPDPPGSSRPSFPGTRSTSSREGALPRADQMFYQFCDLNVEEYVPEGAGGDRGTRAEQRDCPGTKSVPPLLPLHVRRR